MRDLGVRSPRWVAMTLALMLIGCHTEDAQSVPPEVRSVPHEVQLAPEGAEIPLRRDSHGRPIIDVVIDGHAGVALTLDVAASVVGLHASTAKRLGLAAEHRPMLVRGSAAGVGQDIRTGTISTLSAGTNAAVQLRGVTWFEADSGEVDGVLPLAALEPLTVTIDGPKERLILSRDPLPDLGDASVLPYRIDQGVPYVRLDVGGAFVEARLDTGLNAEFKLSPDVASRLTFTTDPARVAWAKDVNGTRRVEVKRFAGVVQLGAVMTDRPQIIVDTGPAAIGADVLSRCVLTFDTVNRRLRAVP